MTAVEASVLVTGGTGALGETVVAELLAAGARVVATWIVPEEREAVAGRLGSRQGLVLVEADLSNEAGARSAAAAATAEGPLAAVVNLVGGYAGSGRVHEAPPDELERMLALNLLTAHRVTRACLPALLEQRAGSIVCVGAKAALEPFSGAAGYITAKASVIAFVRALATEYRDDGIRANAILPSVIDTAANRRAFPKADHSRWVPPAQIARVVRWLCSPDSAATSGAAIPIYGRAG